MLLQYSHKQTRWSSALGAARWLSGQKSVLPRLTSPSLIPGTSMVKGENWVVLWPLHTYYDTWMHTPKSVIKMKTKQKSLSFQRTYIKIGWHTMSKIIKVGICVVLTVEKIRGSGPEIRGVRVCVCVLCLLWNCGSASREIMRVLCVHMHVCSCVKFWKNKETKPGKLIQGEGNLVDMF